MIGYYALLVLVQEQLTDQILQKIDTNASEMGGNLILAIPIELPYASDSEEYTRLDGEIMYGSEVYRLVKQKCYRNILYVVCIKDNQSNQVKAKMGDYSRIFSGQQGEHTNSNIKIINTLSKFYMGEIHFAKPDRDGWCRLSNPKQFSDLYHFAISAGIFRPPQHS